MRRLHDRNACAAFDEAFGKEICYAFDEAFIGVENLYEMTAGVHCAAERGGLGSCDHRMPGAATCESAHRNLREDARRTEKTPVCAR